MCRGSRDGQYAGARQTCSLLFSNVLSTTGNKYYIISSTKSYQLVLKEKHGALGGYRIGHIVDFE